VCLPQVIKSFQDYRGVATTFHPTLVFYPYATECLTFDAITFYTFFLRSFTEQVGPATKLLTSPIVISAGTAAILTEVFVVFQSLQANSGIVPRVGQDIFHPILIKYNLRKVRNLRVILETKNLYTLQHYSPPVPHGSPAQQNAHQ
jgi:hypothetical protein